MVNRRLAAGRTGGNVVPWEQLSLQTRSDVTRHLRSQLGQLEAVGFVPVAVSAQPGQEAAPEAARTSLHGHLTPSYVGVSLKKYT